MVSRSTTITLTSTLLAGSGCRVAELRSPAQIEAGAELLASDGAWCWFQDPRALYSVHGGVARTYAAWMTHDGKLELGLHDHTSGRTDLHTLERNWGADDHNTASLLELPDGRLMVFYAQHNGDGLFVRTSKRPASISAWGPEIAVTTMPNVTYSHPVYLADEGRFYVFWRGQTWKPTYATSTDGLAWSEPEILLQDSERSDSEIRPYLKVTSDARRSIHLAFTDGHPRDEPRNSIYYLRYEAGAFTHANGSAAGSLADLPIAVSAGEKVYDAATTQVRAWVWDIALDADGRPFIAYTRLPGEDDHRYHVARWDGTAWIDDELTPAGKWFPQTPAGEVEPEPHYSGGIVLHPTDPRVVYLSRGGDGQFALERWQLDTTARAWAHTTLIDAATGLNVRPVVPRGAPASQDLVVWMSGEYVFWLENYATHLLMLDRAAAH
jgi:hypothetical protein